MFYPIEGGTLEKIPVGSISNTEAYYECWVPPLGYGINVETGELEVTDVFKRSNKYEEQYFERIELPDWWEEKRYAEILRQKNDPDFVDATCERFRAEEWGRRLRGVWFYNNGKPTYITGCHWFYLNWWKFQSKWLNYRDNNRKFFYVWRYCEEDPDCLGLAEITKRKEGKTARSSCIVYERTSRRIGKHAGMQSKTDADIQEVFDKGIIQPWKGLPDFYRPVYDTGKGDTPKSELRFFRPSSKGKNALDTTRKEKELQSFIDFASSKVDGYDGPELDTYLSDEAGKLINVSIYDRHNTVRFCSEVDGEYIGKFIYTTTVEQMEKGGGEFLKLIKASDFTKRNKNNRTNSGLYVYFLPANETMYIDKHGFPDIGRGTEYFNNMFEALLEEKDERGLASARRKNPFTMKDAFKGGNGNCIYNELKLTDRETLLMLANDITVRGNLKWVDTKTKDKVKWVNDLKGRWERTLWMPPESELNKVEWQGSYLVPTNRHQMISGADTYDHNVVQTGTGSMAASWVKRRINSHTNVSESKKYWLKYHARPPKAEDVYEDLMMQCVWCGCQILIETQKPGCIKHFQRNGMDKFLVYLPGYKDAGIPSTPQNKQEASLMVESHIEDHHLTMDFIDLIQQLLSFEIKNTEEFDLVMAMFWTEYADNYRYFEAKEEDEDSDIIEAEDLFTTYRKTG